MHRSTRLATAAVLALNALAAASQDATSGYDVQRSQSVQNAPAGFVGRKTTDRQHSVGKAKETAGKENTIVLTIGGFAKRCPTAEGIVEGDFEYALRRDDVDAGQRSSQSRRLAAQLKGRVGDDGRLVEVEMKGEFSAEGSGAAPQRRPVRTSFRPGSGGEPDMAAMRRVVDVTADVAVASAVLLAGTLYRQAELEWLKPNACVEFAFDPPNETRAARAKQSIPVRTSLRSTADGAEVPWKTEHLGVLEGHGSIAPRTAEAQPGAPATLTYTASDKPRRGHGISLASVSRAGVADGTWRIIEAARYEGTFRQTDTASLTHGVTSAAQTYTVTGKLVWTQDESGARPPGPPAFGDARSTLYRPSGGEITAHIESVGRTLHEKCTYDDRKTFPIAAFPPAALRWMALEIADDGRYRLTLGLPAQFMQFEIGIRCTNGHASTSPVNDVAVMLGAHPGAVDAEQAVRGVAPPVHRGPRTLDGEWSFIRKAD